MAERSKSRFNWKMPLAGGLAALIALLPSLIGGNDLLAFIATIGLSICGGIALLVAAAFNAKRQTVASLAMLASFCIVGWILFRNSYDIYETGRWLVHANRYKAEVLMQPPQSDGELKHIEWDGWGFAGDETNVYLVFDADDRLAANRKENPARPPGIPCNVWRIRRLESHWYAVTFYTETAWDYCTF